MNYASFQANLRYTFPFRAFVGVGSFVDYGISGAQKMPSGNEVKIFEEEALDRLNAGVAVEAGFPVLEIGSGLLELFISQRWGLTDTDGQYDQDNQKSLLRMSTVGFRLGL